MLMENFFPASSFPPCLPSSSPFLSSIQKCNSFCSQLISFVISKENHRFRFRKDSHLWLISLQVRLPLKFVFCFNLPSFPHLTLHWWILWAWGAPGVFIGGFCHIWRFIGGFWWAVWGAPAFHWWDSLPGRFIGGFPVEQAAESD